MTKIKTFGLGLVLPGFLILSWEYAVTQNFVPSSLVATPTDVVQTFMLMILNGELLFHAMVSGTRLLTGYTLGLSLGVVLGIWVGTSRVAEKMISPVLSIIAPIPPVAWIPLLIIAFGIGDGSKVALIAIGTFFVAFTSAVAGIQQADQKLVEVATSFSKSKSVLVRAVLVPSALSEVFTSARVALALSWILLIAAEVIASSKGLGWLIWDSRNFVRPDEMMAGMLMVGILGKLSDDFIRLSQRRMMSWKQTFSGM